MSIEQPSFGSFTSVAAVILLPCRSISTLVTGTFASCLLPTAVSCTLMTIPSVCFCDLLLHGNGTWNHDQDRNRRMTDT